MISESTVSNVLQADPNAMRAFTQDATVPRWNNIKSGGKYLIPYIIERKHSETSFTLEIRILSFIG